MTLPRSHSLAVVRQGFTPRPLVTPKSIFFLTTLSRFAPHCVGVPMAPSPLLSPTPKLSGEYLGEGRFSKSQSSTRRGQDHNFGEASISWQSKSPGLLVTACVDAALLPQEVCKSHLRPGFAESSGVSEAGSRGRDAGRRAVPQFRP